ncbi:hypothetical protein DFR29_12917 [Tahibacter aquaticus]|jgi:hypothetical protein|uniref:Uncharacterized protein n=1 Tax=Tahibacter aquaticus TaxID=520092 RepID=A0A4R6YIC2_9GAMM|nr:hypothetical protein [Tahibacter aquaticus]TDR36336.1 hypothetical protein DFR29_12917 [Tahibacter aquaticus]
MSFTIELLVKPLPAGDEKAWDMIEAIGDAYDDDDDDRPKAPALLALHERLTARYPCLSSYAPDDDSSDACPWADGPMLGNFGHDMGMLAIVPSRVDEVLPFIIVTAHALGISVADGQSGEIHRAPRVVKR